MAPFGSGFMQLFYVFKELDKTPALIGAIHMVTPKYIPENILHLHFQQPALINPIQEIKISLY